MALRNDVEQGAQNLKDKLQIELHADMRHGTVRYGGQIFNVKVFFLILLGDRKHSTDVLTMLKLAVLFFVIHRFLLLKVLLNCSWLTCHV